MSGLAIGDIAGGGKAWSADKVGDKVVGEITLIERRQQRSIRAGSTV